MSFASVMQQIDSLEVPGDGKELADAVACHDRFTAKLTVAVGAFDESGEWDFDGATSATAWLRDRGMSPGDAVRTVRLGDKLRRLPHLSAAWIAGDVTGGQVRVIADLVIERHMKRFASHETALVPTLGPLSTEDTQRVMFEWRARADALDDGSAPSEPDRSLSHSATLDGRYVTNGAFEAEGGNVIETALRVADTHDLDIAASKRRATAFVDICRFFLDNQQDKTGGRHRPHVNVVVRAETLGAEFIDGELATTGARLDSPTLRRLLCDCTAHRVVIDAAGTILDYGRSTRTTPPNLYNAVVVRDAHCRYPGCDRPPSWCEAHHVLPWELGGATERDNLVLLCSRHHHKIHTKGWTAKLKPDGEFRVTSPWGDTRTTRPPGHIEQLPIGDDET